MRLLAPFRPDRPVPTGPAPTGPFRADRPPAGLGRPVRPARSRQLDPVLLESAGLPGRRSTHCRAARAGSTVLEAERRAPQEVERPGPAGSGLDQRGSPDGVRGDPPPAAPAPAAPTWRCPGTRSGGPPRTAARPRRPPQASRRAVVVCVVVLAPLVGVAPAWAWTWPASGTVVPPFLFDPDHRTGQVSIAASTSAAMRASRFVRPHRASSASSAPCRAAGNR